MNLVLPVVAALAGAAVYGVTGVLQQRSARRVQGDPTNQLGLIRGLISRPLWLFSTIGSVAGFALQGLALGTGPIILVQPLLVTGVLFAALTGFLLSHHPVDWPLMGSLLLTAGGLAAFLLVARPTNGDATLTVGEVLPLAITLLGLVVACVARALRSSGLSRSLSLALASGIVYGVTAAVAKVTISIFSSGGVTAGVTHWSLWALIVLGPLGFLLNQNAFREGELISPTLAVITVTDPLVGIGIGALWLSETIDGRPAAVLGEVLGLAAMALGVWLVAQRAPHLSPTPPTAHQQPPAPDQAGPGPHQHRSDGGISTGPARTPAWRGERP
jgi:drug/metabolite transporter (DMT)-like permease